MSPATPSPAYAELYAMSAFSFQHGASLPQELVARAKALGYAALALTDECSVAGVVRAHEAARKVGLQLLPGAEFGVRASWSVPDAKPRRGMVFVRPDRDAPDRPVHVWTQGETEEARHWLPCRKT